MTEDELSDLTAQMFHTVSPLRGVWFELGVCLIIMNQADPADVSWQPVASLLKAFDAGIIMLDKQGSRIISAVGDGLSPGFSEQRHTALDLARQCYTELISLTKASQVGPVSMQRIDDLSVKMRMELKPAVKAFLDELQQTRVRVSA